MMRSPVVRRITLAALVGFTSARLLGSPAPAAAEDIATEALDPGSWSVQFSVQPNFTLGSYAGSTLSLKRHLGGGKAIRFGVSLNVGTGSEDISGAMADTFATGLQTLANDASNWTVGIGATYLWYSGKAAPIHAYWGVGPTVSWSRGRNEQRRSTILTPAGSPSQTNTITDESRTRAWQVGAGATVGVEWLVARRVGLIAEYGSTLAYTATRITASGTFTSTNSPSIRTSNERETHGWNFSGSGGRLGVSVYF